MIRFCLALASVAFWPQLPPSQWFFLLLVLLVGCSFSVRLRVLIPVIFGLLWGLASGYWLLAHRLPDRWQGVDLQALGTVTGLSSQRGGQCRFDLTLDQLIKPEGSPNSFLMPRKIRLTQYRCQRLPQPGQRWQFSVRLKRPHGYLNPSTFDYSLYLLSRGIDASGYVREGAGRRLSRTSWYGQVDHWRWLIADRTDHSLSGSGAADTPPERDAAATLPVAGDRITTGLEGTV
ncbi:MAG: ComEC/Rec2 family competence protein [Motiliproteus sp.]